MTPRRVLLLVLCLVAGGIVGCGGTGQTTVTVTAPSKTTPVASSSSSGQTSEARQRAEAVRRARARAVAGVVRGYYGNLDAKRLATAWARLSPAVRGQLGGYETWSAGQQSTTAVTVTSVHAVRASKASALVEVALRTTSVDVCSRTVHQRFAGTWALARANGRWVAASLHIEKTGGGTERTDYTECDDTGSRTGSPATAPDSSATPPDYAPDDSDVPDAGTEDDPGFCDTHDCIPNFDNGNGSIVQCADGTYSHSGGIQGACSHHGGVG
jgi:hypothetical protein